MWSRQQEIDLINNIQDTAISNLISLIEDKEYMYNSKVVNFNSPTGTGKTNMIAKLINRMPNYFFVVTTLSKGGLNGQTDDKLHTLITHDNYIVYGVSQLRANTILQPEDILKQIPTDKKLIWIRDEAHINTNVWQDVLNEPSYVIINVSATNQNDRGVTCDFSNTHMLRRINQAMGTPEEALLQLLQVKKQHGNVPSYNPCAIFRVMDNNIIASVKTLCDQYNLTYIDLVNSNEEIAPLCEDDNQYDVIINKFKITEGIDMRRAHVLYIDNKPSNPATLVQVIGRCRRNALLWRKDIDIFAKQNIELLNNTMECYCFYNTEDTQIYIENDNIVFGYSNKISIEALRPNTSISVVNGKTTNGMEIIELEGLTGTYSIIRDENNFNIIQESIPFYNEYRMEVVDQNNLVKVDGMTGRYKIFRTALYAYDKTTNKIYDLHSTQVKKFNAYVSADYIKTHWKLEKSTEEHMNYLTGELVTTDIQYYCGQPPIKKESVYIPISKIIGDINIMGTKYQAEIRQICMQEPAANKAYYEICMGHRKINEYNRLLSQLTKQREELLQPIRGKVLTPRKQQKRDERLQHIMTETETIQNKRQLLCNDIQQDKKIIIRLLSQCVDKYKCFEDTIDLHKHFDVKHQHYITHMSFGNVIKQIAGKSLQDTIVFETDCILQYILESNMIRTLKTRYAEVDFTGHQIEYYSGVLACGEVCRIPATAVDGHIGYYDYNIIYNNKEIATIGPDLLKPVKDKWIEDRAVTSKVSKYCKFNTFLSKKYTQAINEALPQCFNGYNNFNFDSRCNSCLGYCVEYYTKYLVYGELFLKPYIIKAQKEANTQDISIYLIIRACMLMYQDMMLKTYGSFVSKLIPTMSVKDLINHSYKDFVDTVIKLGQRAATFIKTKMRINHPLTVNDTLHSPILSVNHISALCDFVSEDTIIDLKCTNHITKQYVKQVLAYHYLSQFRDDLHIKKVIVYDAVSNQCVEIQL